MDLIFSTDDLEPSKRFAAWQGAICDVYVHVDVNAEARSDYQGFIREAKFGAITMTDVLLSEQRISRRERHIAKLDKDCYYLEFVQQGRINVLQAGQTMRSNAGMSTVFSASEAYDLECIGKVRSLYLEIPRTEFAERFSDGRLPVITTMTTSRGLGRIAAEFCTTLAQEGGQLDEIARARLGGELMDVLALALDMGDREEFSEDAAAQQARLRSVKAWIEAHLTDADLSLERIAKSNGVSLRHLHYLFRLTDVSVSEWILDRRLQRCYDVLTRSELRSLSITEVAYQLGFSSSSYFSTVFRRKFGHSPSDLRRR
ncbi:helix-turn-helix domain-containing protein [Bradyrhizobium sp. CIAT3101]|uniref:helix-turn-helix domain-containing protein n=1 Tax=Bradyrhizobium sp. CIAT3101 TaxID=439387 RepID=UPI0024B26FF4|nr:helix-turn-helix domain-containing protein [Bradyrhizobium sp. CIAT3101]WFU81985.1 helix-turn-helix domain-containing protein [Bradyrhizobium sp. CIAT3101]